MTNVSRRRALLGASGVTAAIALGALPAASATPSAPPSPSASNLQVAPADRARMSVPPPYQVLSGRRVTFRLAAPHASSVDVEGEWPGGLQGSSTVHLTKDAQGIWSASVGPLASDIWSYSFTVDGAAVQPTFGPLGGPLRLPANAFVIPGGYGNDFAPRASSQSVLAYASVPFMGSTKMLSIYTPPDYYVSRTKRYPVLYLTMGGPHDGSNGPQDAYAFNLLDNLIASHRAKPMIIVVLDPSAPSGNSVGWSSFAGGGNQTNQRYVTAADAIATQIVPWVDSAFRTIPERTDRAIGGFSSPGAQGFLSGARHPKTLATVFAFSGGFPTWPGVGVQIESRLDPKQYSGPDLNRVPDMKKLGALIPELDRSAHMKLVFLSVGTNEPLIQTFRLMETFLRDRGVAYHAVEQRGYTHEARNIRVSLRDLLPLIFR